MENESLERILEGLNDRQKAVCVSKDNILLTSCPGSGKTKTIVHRLAYLVEKYSDSRKYNIAITYTNKAADEIKERLELLQSDKSKVWAGTIHQFCMTFIIRPYAMYSERLRRGYRIIDEYVDSDYKSKAIEVITHKKVRFNEIDKYVAGNIEIRCCYKNMLKGSVVK